MVHGTSDGEPGLLVGPAMRQAPRTVLSQQSYGCVGDYFGTIKMGRTPPTWAIALWRQNLLPDCTAHLSMYGVGNNNAGHTQAKH